MVEHTILSVISSIYNYISYIRCRCII